MSQKQQRAYLNNQPIVFTQTTFNVSQQIPTHTTPLLIAQNETPFNYNQYLPSWPTDYCIFADQETNIADDELINQLTESTQSLQNIPYSQNLKDILSNSQINYGTIQRACRSTFLDAQTITDIVNTECVPVQFESMAEFAFKGNKHIQRINSVPVQSYLNYLHDMCPVCLKYCCKVHEYSEKQIFHPDAIQQFRDSKDYPKIIRTPVYLNEINNFTLDLYTKSGRKEHGRRVQHFLSARRVQIQNFNDLQQIYRKIYIKPKYNNNINFKKMTRKQLGDYLKVQILQSSKLTKSQINLIVILARISDGNVPLLCSIFDVCFDEILLQLYIQDVIQCIDSPPQLILHQKMEINMWTDPLNGFMKLSFNQIQSKTHQIKSDFGKIARKLIQEPNFENKTHSMYPYKAYCQFTPLLFLTQYVSKQGTILSKFASISRAQSSNPYSESVPHQTFGQPCYHPGLYCSQIWCPCAQAGISCSYACGCYGQPCHMFWPGCIDVGEFTESACYFQGLCCQPDYCISYRKQGKLISDKKMKLPPTSLLSLRISFPLRVGLINSPIHGFGVAVVKSSKLCVGMPFLEYVGEIVSVEEAETRGRISDAYGLTYLFTLKNKDEIPAPELDAGLRGSISRYMNHLEKANVRTRLFRFGSENIVVMMANEKFLKGELYFNYGKQFKSAVAQVVLKKVVQ
ncbi:Histone-lysine N-methyltransferase [Spironucleus salmonicida]|uniref:Histone-lysine N-methyltransferase n=2 Tax=Spironucleus TaxID=39709 RepID=V6LH30_9EUKA|nr:Histone-lysine N-methyltransferase [Spironucleus salmonicida]|eukprot:EST43021.1 Histone-lysine N-methyltransferase [Spironucleus salmonicida]